MEFFNFIAEFSYPSAIIAAYIVITLTKRYSKINSKYYMLIAVFTGIGVVVLEEIISNPITIQKIIAGALSGIIALFSYDSINKILKIKRFLDGFQSDGYQWIKAEYNGTVGYIQADTHNWHYFKIF